MDLAVQKVADPRVGLNMENAFVKIESSTTNQEWVSNTTIRNKNKTNKFISYI